MVSVIRAVQLAVINNVQPSLDAVRPEWSVLQVEAVILLVSRAILSVVSFPSLLFCNLFGEQVINLPLIGSGCCPDGFVCSKDGEACEVDQSGSFSSIVLPTSSATTTNSKTSTTTENDETVTGSSTSDDEAEPSETKPQGSAGNKLQTGGNWVRSLGGLVGIAVGGVMFL